MSLTGSRGLDGGRYELETGVILSLALSHLTTQEDLSLAEFLTQKLHNVSLPLNPSGDRSWSSALLDVPRAVLCGRQVSRPGRGRLDYSKP